MGGELVLPSTLKSAFGSAPIGFTSGWNWPSVKPAPWRLRRCMSSAVTGSKDSLCRRAPTCASLIRLELKTWVWLTLYVRSVFR